MPNIYGALGRALTVGVFVALSVSGADATIVGGSATSVENFAGTPQAGSFTVLSVPFTESNPDNTVGQDNFNDFNLYAFNEAQNIQLTSALAVDIGSTIPVGTVIASHYVFIDPPSAGGIISGFVEFDAEVLGIATTALTLIASDALVNPGGVTYQSPNARGLELAADQAANVDDTVAINGSNPNRIDLTFAARSPGDFVRVFTAASPNAAVPLPAAGWALLAGLAGLGVAARRRR